MFHFIALMGVTIKSSLSMSSPQSFQKGKCNDYGNVMIYNYRAVKNSSSLSYSCLDVALMCSERSRFQYMCVE